MEFEFPMLINSSAKVSERVEGKSLIVESTAGSALTSAVCAEAGSAAKERAKSPVARRNLDNFMIAVYPRELLYLPWAR
jgi:hypothetical protein